MSQFPAALPGFGPGSLTLSPRNVFVQDTDAGDFLPAGKLIDPAQTRDPGASVVSQIRPGLLLGKISSTASGAVTLPTIGLYATAVIDTLQGALVGGTSTQGTLTAAGAVEVVRRLGTSGTLVLTGAPTATGIVAQNTVVYTAVNTTSGVISFNQTVSASYTAGTLVGANDGSATPVTVFCGTLFPENMLDLNGSNLPAAPLTLIPITFKTYDVTQIINYPAAANTTLIAKLKTYLRTAQPAATFSDDF